MHCGRKARAKRDFISYFNFFCQDGSNKVSHAPGWVPEVGFIPQAPRQTGTQTDRENRHYENIYIDTSIIIFKIYSLYVLVYQVFMCLGEMDIYYKEKIMP